MSSDGDRRGARRACSSFFVLALSCALGPTAKATLLLTEAGMHDAYGTAPNLYTQKFNDPGRPVRELPWIPLPNVFAEAVDPETNAGGFALAKGGLANGRTYADSGIDAGVAAVARSWGNRVGSASATVRIDLNAWVVADLSQRPAAVAEFAARCPNGCPLAANFVHQTTGYLGYSSNISWYSSASFRESLMRGSEYLSVGEVTVRGHAQGAGPAELSAYQDWTLDDFYPAGTVPGGVDVIGGLEWLPFDEVRVFNHFALLDGLVANFFYDSSTNTVVGSYRFNLTQTAMADFGGLDYTFGLLGANFANTSHLAITGLSDPTGTFDLASLPFTVQFVEASTVPLPPAVALFAAALALLAAPAGRNGVRPLHARGSSTS
ncbi:MAG: hypothetical protein HY943_22380 [Gammaproteobacteria bacterium]|nr:hypothetical protein [Gammaproteobacteria bacterium]